MAVIPAGEFVAPQKGEARVKLAAFLLDRHPVTNRQFLEFVRANPAWRKSAVKRIFADEAYLGSWPRDLDHGGAAQAQCPVTSVSWFAARAYATWAGKRLPSLAEWEVAAAASGTAADARGDSGLDRGLFCGAGAAGFADPADYAAFMRYAFRSSLRGHYRIKNLGFRCAKDLETAR